MNFGNIFLDVAFLGVAAITAVSAALVGIFKNLLHAAVALFFCLSGVAALYILLGADFLGVTQLMVYAGGILVLIIFGVFMTSKIYGVEVELGGPSLSTKVGLTIAAGLFFVLYRVISVTEWPALEVSPRVSTTARLGDLFLTKYVLAFEFISLLLLLAMIGAVSLVRKEMGDRS